MAQVTLNIPDIVIDVLDFLDRTFGYAEELEFAPSTLVNGDEVIVCGCRWRVINATARCPFSSVPAEYDGYTLDEDWAYVYNVDADARFTLTDYVPAAFMITLLEQGN